MFYDAKPHIFEKAKILWRNMTKAETKLWEYLKGKKMCNFGFRAQHPIDIFIADFYCHQLKLVIEVDGGIHQSMERIEYDIGREAELNNYGIRVVRSTNEEIEENINEVIERIKKICLQQRTMLQSPL